MAFLDKDFLFGYFFHFFVCSVWSLVKFFAGVSRATNAEIEYAELYHFESNKHFEILLNCGGRSVDREKESWKLKYVSLWFKSGPVKLCNFGLRMHNTLNY